MGCCHVTAKRVLEKAKNELGEDLTLSDIGRIIYEYRNAPDEKDITTLLDSRWTGPNCM
jgi:hypothetical protein